MIDKVIKLFKTLNSDDDPAQISAGFVLGMMIGLTPILSLHNLLLLLVVCIIRVHIGGVFLSFALFSGIAYLFAPAMIGVGESLLANEALVPTWTSLYQSDFWRLAHFNHTLTLGSLVTGLVLAIPMFFVFKALIVKYRDSLLSWVQKTRVVQALKASTVFTKLSSLAGADK